MGPQPGYPIRDLNRRNDWTWEPVRKGDRVQLDLTRARGSLSVAWMDHAEGVIYRGESVIGGRQQTLMTPFPGPAVLYLKKESA